MREPCIGVLGPVPLAEFRDVLPEDWLASGRLQGLGGPPVHFHVRELLRRGHRVVLFTLDPMLTEERIIETGRLKICLGRYTPHRGRNAFRRERDYLLQAVRRERPDVLSAHWTYEFALAAAASGIPHVVTAHDAPWQVLRRNPIPYRMVRTAMAYCACRRAQRLVAVSPYVADHLRRFGFRGGPIEVVPNGLPGRLRRPAAPRSPGSPTTFASLFSGGWQGLKNGPRLIEAFALLRRSLPGARLLMIGEQCDAAGSAAAWARARGMDGGIDFLGRQPHDRVMDLLAAQVDVLVHPSLEESFGMPLIEAAAIGVPVIGGRWSGAVPWVLGDGRYGVLVDVRSPAAIAAAMAELGRDEGRRRRLAEAAQAAMWERFDLERTVDRYEAIFAELRHPADGAGRRDR